MNHHHLTNTCTIEHVQLPRVLVVASECPWLKQLIPSYALSAPRSSSFGRIRPNSASPGLAMELGFRESSIVMNSCAPMKDGDIGDQARHQGQQLKLLREASTSCVWAPGGSAVREG